VRRYSFRLESVLRVRRAQEELARQELARVNRRLREATGRRDTEEERYRDVASVTSARDHLALAAERARGERAAHALDLARRAADDTAVAAAVRHAAWRETAQRVAALERLDNRRREEHSREAQQAEVAETDDFVAARWLREDVSLVVVSTSGGSAR